MLYRKRKDNVGGSGGGGEPNLVEERVIVAASAGDPELDFDDVFDGAKSKDYEVEVIGYTSANMLLGMQLRTGGSASPSPGYWSRRTYQSGGDNGSDQNYLGTNEWFVGYSSAIGMGMSYSLLNVTEDGQTVLDAHGYSSYGSAIYNLLVAGGGDIDAADGFSLRPSIAFTGVVRIYRKANTGGSSRGTSIDGVPVHIGTVLPTDPQFVWFDITGGNLQIKYEDGL